MKNEQAQPRNNKDLVSLIIDIVMCIMSMMYEISSLTYVRLPLCITVSLKKYS